ncbi:putative sh3 domain signaling protein [Phaeomoniella chlamydospora]|uniref:Putative sh3 domain signaling protein n=1 Tax=Phaeomoniella chlamydospora TaxID=158046 RepID=A0A0G2F4A7_PHACM|nr:putative sh3 domain signaling protein [Phaeomoniella chlamydospora]
MKRSADESQVSVLLKDFDEADKLLGRIIDAAKAWRESWLSILAYQSRMLNELETLYGPILGAGDGYQGHVPVETPQNLMARTSRLKEEYDDLKRDLTQEITQVDMRMVRPATEAKDALQPMKKTIKKREDKKLDFERYQSRVDSARKKMNRSDRESAALAKSETDLAKATEAYNDADDSLRRALPPLIACVFSVLPHLLAAQIQIQNSMLAHYYTMLHNYCSDYSFPSPSPPMDEVIRTWEEAFRATQHEAEAIGIIASGKAVRGSMSMEENKSASSILNGFGRRASGQSALRKPSTSPGRNLPPSPSFEAKPKIASAPSPSASAMLYPPEPSPGPEIEPVVSRTSSEYYSPQAYAPAAPRTDYFARDRLPSNSGLGKKKPPPPPPPRKPSDQGLWVTALYDFNGQSGGDLVFKEGDRIRVLKKTESTDDWWQGELRGVKGSFPANYCE